MALMNLISENEKEMMEKYIDNYATDHREVSIEEILTVWENYKEMYLSNIFTDRLIFSKTVEISKSESELANELWNALRRNPFCEEFYALAMDLFDDDDYYVMNDFRSLVDPMTTLVQNRFSKPSIEIPNPKEKHPIKIQTGCKATKILGKIAEAYDLDGYEEFRLIHSQILNQKKIKGELCISIHPFDYMTMSDNTSGWSSCMSWMEEGCYRQGTVEMMNSDSVVVAYLKSSNDMNVSGGTWNNKKWRELFIVSPKLITNVKSYPYYNPELTTLVLDWLKELSPDKDNYSDEICHFYNEESFIFEEKDITLDFYTELMYNDFDNTDEGQYAYLNKNLNGCNDFCYSGPSQCMACGHTCVSFETEGCLACDNCEILYSCEWCENSIHDERDLHYVDGMTICDNCYEYHTDEDSFFNEIHMTDNLVPIYLKSKDGYINMKAYDVRFYVDEFPIKLKEEMPRYFKTLKTGYAGYNHIFYVEIEDCTKEGLELFGFYYDDDPYEISKEIKKLYGYPEYYLKKVDDNGNNKEIFDFYDMIWRICPACKDTYYYNFS